MFEIIHTLANSNCHPTLHNMIVTKIFFWQSHFWKPLKRNSPRKELWSCHFSEWHYPLLYLVAEIFDNDTSLDLEKFFFFAEKAKIMRLVQSEMLKIVFLSSWVCVCHAFCIFNQLSSFANAKGEDPRKMTVFLKVLLFMKYGCFQVVKITFQSFIRLVVGNNPVKDFISNLFFSLLTNR